MKIQGKVALVTGAGSGIGEATARELVGRGVKAIGLVDRSANVELVARAINEAAGRNVADAFIGDVTEEAFRTLVLTGFAPGTAWFTFVCPRPGLLVTRWRSKWIRRPAKRSYSPPGHSGR